jgi:hypothetical protein
LISAFHHSQEAHRLHEQGRFVESIEMLAQAEQAALDAIAVQHPEQAAFMRANPANAEVSVSCFAYLSFQYLPESAIHGLDPGADALCIRSGNPPVCL